MTIDCTFLFGKKHRGIDKFHIPVFSLATGEQAPQFCFKSLLAEDWRLSLCVWPWCSGQVESGFLTGDKWPWFHFLASSQRVGNQCLWESRAGMWWERGLPERGLAQAGAKAGLCFHGHWRDIPPWTQSFLTIWLATFSSLVLKNQEEEEG